jgi:hypothetical protein
MADLNLVAGNNFSYAAILALEAAKAFAEKVAWEHNRVKK